MLDIPNNILEFFFSEINLRGRYEINIQCDRAYIIPREEEKYYKPIIRIPDLKRLANLLREYIEAINDFNKRNNTNLQEYQDLSYVLNIMLFNMAFSDADDLNKYIETRISFFKDNSFAEFACPCKVLEDGRASFYAQRQVESFGLETPYIMKFYMQCGEDYYDLPIIRYGINEEGICFIYAVQIGRGRTCDSNNPNYKKVVNQVNQGVKEGRGISPSFVLILALFLKMLNDQGINKIVIPDFLFNRYKKYYRANTTCKSDEILARMFHNITTLVGRIDTQITGFNIQSYPLDVDSYYHIDIVNLESENKLLRKLTDDN